MALRARESARLAANEVRHVLLRGHGLAQQLAIPAELEGLEEVAVADLLAVAAAAPEGRHERGHLVAVAVELQPHQAVGELARVDLARQVCVEELEDLAGLEAVLLLGGLGLLAQALHDLAHHGLVGRAAPDLALADHEVDDALHAHVPVLVHVEAEREALHFGLAQLAARALEHAPELGGAQQAAAVGVEVLEQAAQVAGLHLVAVELRPQAVGHVAVVRVPHEDHQVRVRHRAVPVQVHAREELVLLLRRQAELERLEAAAQVALGDAPAAPLVEVLEALAQLARDPPLEALLDQVPQLLLVAPDLPRALRAGLDGVQHLQVRHVRGARALEAVFQLRHVRLR